MKTENNPESLMKKIKYEFNKPELLEKALTHSSFANNGNCSSNELLEFLGDSVIGLVVTEYLYNSFPGETEGTLSKIKGRLCSRELLNKKAKKIKIGDYLRIEPDKIAKDRKENFLGNALEALIGAIYLDSGFEDVKRVIHNLFSSDFKNIDLKNLRDPKTLLQEMTQKKYQKIPEYRLLSEEGVAHEKTFRMEVFVPEGKFRGKGKNKKEAETDAAKKALRKIMGNKI